MPHITKDFDNSITQLRTEVLRMAAQTRLNLERAWLALNQRDKSAANVVIADDDEVDQSELKIDRLGIELLVRFHPVASDLRLILTSLKLSKNLERISDHATNIAKRAKKLIKLTEASEVTLIEPIYTLADQMLRDAIRSYADLDESLAASLPDRDLNLDRQHHVLLDKFKHCIEMDSSQGALFLHLILITRSLERIGDLSVNIGEEVIFLTSAQSPRVKTPSSSDN